MASRVESLQVETLAQRRSSASARILSHEGFESDAGTMALVIADSVKTPEETIKVPKKVLFEKRHIIGMVVATTLAAIAGSTPLSDEWPQAHTMLAIGAFVACFWVFEVLPLAVGGMLPWVLIPAANLASSAQVANWSFGWLQVMMIGAFLVNAAIEHVNLHTRIATAVLVRVGVDSPTVVLAVFMMLAWVLSMIISNTATTVMLSPLAIGIIETAAEKVAASSAADKEGRLRSLERFSNGLLLGICYGATAGGLGTLIGSAPNLVLAQQPIMANQIDFVNYMAFGLPVSTVVGLIAFSVLHLSFLRGVSVELGDEMLRTKLAELGPMSSDEKAVSAVVALQVLLFCVRPFTIERVLPDFNDASVAVLTAILLFFIPSQASPGESLITWKVAQASIPWGVLLLIGGGFSIAEGFGHTGLTNVIGDALGGIVPALPLPAIVLLLVTTVTFLTELTSNTATAMIMLPILAAVSYETLIHPMLLLIPVGMATSFAFSLPAATPPNSIIFATGRVSFTTFLRTGVKIDGLAICLASFLGLAMAIVVFDALGPFPELSCKATPEECQWVQVSGTVAGRDVSAQACIVKSVERRLCRIANGTVVEFPEVLIPELDA